VYHPSLDISSRFLEILRKKYIKTGCNLFFAPKHTNFSQATLQLSGRCKHKNVKKPKTVKKSTNNYQTRKKSQEKNEYSIVLLTLIRIFMCFWLYLP